MPIELPNLDDIRYDDLLEGAFHVLPRISPEWSNRNPSDPGVTLLEMFAALIEMDIYQVNRISNNTYRNFLQLLGVSIETEGEVPTHAEIEVGMVEALRRLDGVRSISQNDLLKNIMAYAGEKEILIRAYCCDNIDFSRFDVDRRVAHVEKAGHTTVLLLTDNHSSSGSTEKKCNLYTSEQSSPCRYKFSWSRLCDLYEELTQTRILSSRIHLRSPSERLIRLNVTLALAEGTDVHLVRNRILEEISKFYNPVLGGEDGLGYRPGRSYKVTETIEVIESVPGVEYVGAIETEQMINDEWGAFHRYLEINYYEFVWISSVSMEMISIRDV